jgi:cytosine/adenosine deaminase-related metal-dependent hydrolase
VDLIEGICGPPQSDASLGEARGLCGDRLILWGGLPQDLLAPGTPEEEFRQAAGQAAREARADRRALLGVADRVPVSSPLERLQLLQRLAAEP